MSESECKRELVDSPVPFAVGKALRTTCLAALADGWIHTSDLCPSCTRQFMAALDGIAGPLKWHENYLARAAEGVAR